MIIHSVNISKVKGTLKSPVDEININHRGIINDAHSGPWHRQVSLLAKESIDKFANQKGNRDFKPGEFAENITTVGFDLTKVSLLDRFIIGNDDVELEVTQIGKKCHGGGCAIYQEVGKCVMPQEGVFCRVINGGTIKAGDKFKYIPYLLRFQIITVSDRASQGEYEDLSGPTIFKAINEHFINTRWHFDLTSSIVPDDPSILGQELDKAKKSYIDVVITTGGTGIGPRDITYEVANKHCDKIIPGIMEHIRWKYGQNNPQALISRSISGVMNKSLIYTLPGSVKAAKEYMDEILKTLEHLIEMAHGLGH